MEQQSEDDSKSIDALAILEMIISHSCCRCMMSESVHEVNPDIRCVNEIMTVSATVVVDD